MEAPVEEHFRDDVPPTTQGKLREQHPVAGEEGLVQPRAAEDFRPHHAKHIDTAVDQHHHVPVPDFRTIRVRAQRRALVAGRLAAPIDLLHQRVAQDAPRIGVQRLDATRQVVGVEHVVVCGPLEVAARRELERPVVVAGRSEVLGEA